MSKFKTPDKVIYICTGSKCGKRGGKSVSKDLKDLIKKNDLGDEIEVIKIECTDRCKFAPVLTIQPGNIWLKEYDEEDAAKILKTTLNQ